MNLDYLDNKIPQRWLLLLCYYLPFCNLLSFYIRPSNFYFKCRTFINELKHSGQKDFPLAQLPNFLYLLEKYSFKETEKKLANEIISEILIKDHNVRETLGICDHAYIINAGNVLAAGRPEEIVDNPSVRKVYLGEHFKL